MLGSPSAGRVGAHLWLVGGTAFRAGAEGSFPRTVRQKDKERGTFSTPFLPIFDLCESQGIFTFFSAAFRAAFVVVIV